MGGLKRKSDANKENETSPKFSRQDIAKPAKKSVSPSAPEAAEPCQTENRQKSEMLRKNFASLESSAKNLKFEIDNAELCLHEHFIEQKRRLQLAYEEHMLGVNKYYEKLMQQMDESEEEAHQSNQKINELKEAKIISETANNFIEGQSEYGNQLQSGNEINTTNNDVLQIKEKIEEKRQNIKKAIFNNRLVKFERDDECPSAEEVIGHLKFESFDSSKTRFICGSGDFNKPSNMHLIDLSSSECIISFNEHLDLVNCIKLLPNNRILSASEDNTIKLWNLLNGKCIRTFICYEEIYRIELLSNSRFLTLSGKNSILIWSLDSHVCLKTINVDGVFRSNKIFPNEQLLFGSDENIFLIDLNSEEILKRFLGHTENVLCLEILSEDRIISSSLDSTIKIWDFKTCECLQTLEGHTDAIKCVSVLSSNKVISGSDDATIKIWDLATGSTIKTLHGHTECIWKLSSIADKQIISCSHDGMVKIWDLELGICIKSLEFPAPVHTLEVF